MRFPVSYLFISSARVFHIARIEYCLDKVVEPSRATARKTFNTSRANRHGGKSLGEFTTVKKIRKYYFCTFPGARTRVLDNPHPHRIMPAIAVGELIAKKNSLLFILARIFPTRSLDCAV